MASASSSTTSSLSPTAVPFVPRRSLRTGSASASPQPGHHGLPGIQLHTGSGQGHGSLQPSPNTPSPDRIGASPSAGTALSHGAAEQTRVPDARIIMRHVDVLNEVLTKNHAAAIMLFEDNETQAEETDGSKSTRITQAQVKCLSCQKSLSGELLGNKPMVVKPSPLQLGRNYHSSDSIDNLDLEGRSQSAATAQRHQYQTGLKWPPGRLPVEIYEMIGRYLSRDDVKSMRLTCREFNQYTAQILFKNVVVAFNTEIYDTIKPLPLDQLWKSPLSDVSARSQSTDKSGPDVFRGFGEYIQRYGMSFEIDQHSLARPPSKRKVRTHATYWGLYEWPPPEYCRYDGMAELEKTADQILLMKTAFKHLTKVNELALAIDSGLGWLSGQDLSLMDLVLDQPSEIFGSNHGCLNRRAEAQTQLWKGLQARHSLHSGSEQPTKEYSVFQARAPEFPNTNISQDRTLWDTTELPSMGTDLINRAFDGPNIPRNSASDALSESPVRAVTINEGVLYTTHDSISEISTAQSALTPQTLRKSQKEWLQENEWAQRAFISSYILAVVDNRPNFGNVTTFQLRDVSSSFLLSFCRRDFWDALPALSQLLILVKPDWRLLTRDESGSVEIHDLEPGPSLALDSFLQLLRDVVTPRKSVRKMHIGWSAGGEHSKGLFARNSHLLPAPVASSEIHLQPTAASQQKYVIQFPCVEHLVLENCWVSPPTLLSLVKQHQQYRLATLEFKSVSLTAWPIPEQANAVPGIVAPQNVVLQVPQLPPPPAFLSTWLQSQAQMAGSLSITPLAVTQFLTMLSPQDLAIVAAAFAAHVTGPMSLIMLATLVAIHYGGLPVPQVNAFGAAGLIGAAPFVPWLAPPAVTIDPMRDGSWPYLLSLLKPGASTSIPTLQRLVFTSCGYARLPQAQPTRIDQRIWESAPSRPLTPWFSKKIGILTSKMMSSKDALLGQIVQWIPHDEEMWFQGQVGMRLGWSEQQEGDGDGWKESERAEWDGWYKGGTGRFSGIVERDVNVDNEEKGEEED